MSPLAQFQKFTQQVYLVIKGRYFDGIPYPDPSVVLDDDGTNLMVQTADWTNMFLDELETETNPDGTPTDWKWAWQLDFALGTATEGNASITSPTSINYLLADENRYVQVTQDGTVVSNWAVVSPDQISNMSDRVTQDMCAQVGTSIVFSRQFRDYEDGGAITGDVSAPLPRLAVAIGADGTLNVTNVKVLTLVKPQALLQLGTAKNTSLPDIVQGGLSPSYAQKYGNLLAGAIARNSAGAVADEVQTDDYSGIAGVY